MRAARALLYLVFLLAASPWAPAADYYVDSSTGNDAWSGKQPTSAGNGEGPWRSFVRLSKAPLAPGDVVHLRCGRTWNETLKLYS